MDELLSSSVSVRESLLSIAPVAPGEVLVVDGEEAGRKSLVQAVNMLAMMASQAETGEHAISVAAEKASTLDCILLSVLLPDIDGWEVMRRLREDPETAVIPVVLVLPSPPTDEELVRIVQEGAVDHFVKPLTGLLVSAKVRAICERSRMQRELRNKLQYALENAAHDPLTGLFNRRYFERRLREEAAHARRHRRPFSLILLDLDYFKLVNDTYGHEDGDRVLKHLAEVVQAHLREDDIACRYGGEEFVLLLRATSGTAARVVANRLRTAMASAPIRLGASGELRHVAFSAGVSAADERNSFLTDDIVARADAALYRAKRAGRNRVEAE